MPGRTIAHFELLQEFRSKPGDAAYKALDTRTGHLVVLHVLRETARFTSHRELRAAAALSHPNVLDVWEVGEFEDKGRLTPFFVTPFLNGVTLEELIRQAVGPLTPERVGEIALQTCAGLQAVHDRALIHGHLTPGSILITDGGLVKIMDFGLIREVLAESISPYASPEQVSARQISTASDIFSFGAIIYEALTLRNPFARLEPIATAAAIMQQVPPPAAEVNPAVSRAVSQVIQRAMAKESARRFISAREFGEAFQAALRNEPIAWIEQARPRIREAQWALDKGDLPLAGHIIDGLESDGFLDAELRSLRGRLERELRNRAIRQLLERVQLRLANQEFSSAVREVQEALNIDPENSDALRLRAQIERAAERERIDRVRAEQEHLYRSAIQSHQQGDIDVALAILERVMELTRQIPEAPAPEAEVRYQSFYRQLRDEWESGRAAYLEARQQLAERRFQDALEACARQLSRNPWDQRFQALMREVQELEERERQNRSEFFAQTMRHVEMEPDLDRRMTILSDALQRYPAEPRFAESLSLMRQRRDLLNSILAAARQFEARGQLSEALEQIERLRSVHPQFPGIDLEVNAIMLRRSQQARTEMKTRWVEQADREAASGNDLRTLELLRAATKEFPEDSELASRTSRLERASVEQARVTPRTLPEEIPQPPAPVLDHVHFTITAPSRLAAGDSFELYFWVHLDQQRKSVIDRAMLALGVTRPEEMVVKSEGPVPLPRGTVVSARVSIEGLNVDPCEKNVVWSGEAGCASFVIAVLPGAAQRQYHGTVSIRVNSCEIARMDFLLRVAGPSGRVPAKLKRHATAFASYASEDRDAVLARVQGMQKVAPWLKVFMDVLDMRSGDSWEKKLRKEIRGSDIFYLFWCSHARASEWVNREWRYAYEKRGLEFIDPVPLESPSNAPPPDELKTKHFNDLWTELNRKAHGS